MTFRKKNCEKVMDIFAANLHHLNKKASFSQQNIRPILRPTDIWDRNSNVIF